MTRGQGAKKVCGGKPSPLPETEPSTRGQIVNCYYFLKYSKQLSKDMEIVKEIEVKLREIWSRVNPRLPLLENSYVIQRLKTLIEKAKGANSKKLKVKKLGIFEKSLDTLFDISACTCDLPTRPCKDPSVNCTTANCNQEHIVCLCDASKRVPIEDRLYLRDQRAKVGPKGSFQLGPVDKVTERREQKKLERQPQHASTDVSTDVSSESDMDYMSSSSASADNNAAQVSDPAYQPEATSSGVVYSGLKIPRFCMELVRGDVSSRCGASIANALLLDLQDFGLLKLPVPLKNLFLDKNKVSRQMERVRITSTQQMVVDSLVCIGVDGKVDNDTMLFREVKGDGELKKLKQDRAPEHHLTFTRESGDKPGIYLTHRNLPLKGATGNVMAAETFSVLDDYDSTTTIKAILCDNTASNTGGDNGLVSCLERKLGRKLHTIGCSLHQNELPFRAVFKCLDGATKSPTQFSGPIGKLCADDIQDKPQIAFEPVESPLEDIAADVLDKLSLDQRLLYEYTRGISLGQVDVRFASYKIGPLNQARWLTLAIRLMAIYTRGYFAPENRDVMMKLIQFIVQVYSPTWFMIKKDGLFHHQAAYLFFALQQMKKQHETVKSAAIKNLKYNAFALLPENVILSMFKCDDVSVREAGLQKVISIRNSEQLAQKKGPKRLKRIAAINEHASHWSEMVDLDQPGVCEPALTESFSVEQLNDALKTGEKLEIPDLPSHTQSVERCVKLVSEASHAVYGVESRHRHINARVLGRSVRPAFETKSSYVEIYNEVF